MEARERVGMARRLYQVVSWNLLGLTGKLCYAGYIWVPLSTWLLLFLPKPLKSWLWRLVDPRNCRGCSAERYNLKTKAIGICKRNCLCICRDILGSYMLRNKITFLYCCFSRPWFVSHLKFNPLCSASSWFSQVAENGSFQTAQWLSCLG